MVEVEGLGEEAEVPEEEPEEEQPDYTLNEAVLDYFREKHKRGTGGQVRGQIRLVLSCIYPICQVWTAPALLPMLRAQDPRIEPALRAGSRAAHAWLVTH